MNERAERVERFFTWPVIVATTALGGGAAFAAVEEDPETWDGVWWAITTMTTVGYGATLGRP